MIVIFAGVCLVADDEVRVLKCIANDIRFNILTMLAEEEKCVCELIEELDKEQSLISHHLQSLRECGLIKKRREGRRIMYRLADESLPEFLEDVKELSKNYC